MIRGFLLWSLLASAPPVQAQEAAPPAQEAAAAEEGGLWSRQGSSLVLRDSSGTVVNEIPLRTSEELMGSGLRMSRTTGNVSENGRFAWTLHKTTVWNLSKTKALREDRTLRFFGTSGRELWSQPGADAPAQGEPVAMNATGETVAVSVLGPGGWKVSVRSFLGTPVWELDGLQNLSSVSLTPEGAYALIRWSETDKSATHTFVAPATGERKDIPSDEFVLGAARISADGKVFAGLRLLHEFKKAPVKP
ncbi:MAG: hypothetical protein HY924_07790 [Elusimicrobia bacterium]|nr:hypothetical protein [Elusimicrobiota bacterium]